MYRSEMSYCTRCRSLATRGFTLMEIILVVVIIGILASFVVTNYVGMTTQAKVTRAQTDVATLKQQIGLFEVQYGHLPTEEEGGLMALLERPSTIPEDKWRRIGDSDPIDPWSNPYIYLVGSARIDKNRDYNIYSMGDNQIDDGMEEDDIK
jgi:general secretion pathway protein G